MSPRYPRARSKKSANASKLGSGSIPLQTLDNRGSLRCLRTGDRCDSCVHPWRGVDTVRALCGVTGVCIGSGQGSALVLENPEAR